MDAFFQTGSIRLGTLHGYRDTAAFGTDRGDHAEGSSDTRLLVNRATTVEKGSFLNQFINMSAGGEILNCTFINRRNHQDMFIFCASGVFTPELFHRWQAKDSRTDACYEIFDWIGFRAEISKRIRQIAWYFESSYIQYVKGDVPAHSSLRDYPVMFIKQHEYGWQLEHRGAWSKIFPNDNLPHVDIEIPDARRFCRPVAVLANGQVRYMCNR